MADTDRPDGERIAFATADGVATITMVREARLNAFDEAMHAQLRSALDRIEADDATRAVILTGSGRAFSAGQDLGERAEAFDHGAPPDLHASLDDNYNPLIRRLAALPVPVVAAVNGIAFGGGAALALACDIVVAGASARFQFGFVHVGLGPDCGASWTLPRLVGQARALDLMLTGRPVPADEALAIGLASRVVPDDGLAATARDIARGLAERSPAAVAAIKRQLRGAAPGSLDVALDRERDEQAALSRTQPYRDAVLRFARPQPRPSRIDP